MLSNFLKIIIKNRSKYLVFLIIFAWIFSGWPQLNYKSFIFPPEIKEIQAASPETFTTTGSFNAPTGIYAVDAECWGGGGGGGGSTNANKVGSGGGGGAYSKATSISVTPGQSYTVTVGTGGPGSLTGSDGGDSWFLDQLTVLAKGGIGGQGNDTGGNAAGGQASSGVGSTKWSGGAGGEGSGTADAGGGGGGSAGRLGDGGNGGNASGTTPGSAGAAGSDGGAVGGVGGAPGFDGNPGSAPGGGGSGSGKKSGSNNNGGNGADGQCVIYYSDIWAPSTALDTYSSTWTFASPPANDSTSQISMTATSGYDYTTPINYLFTLDNTNCGADAGTGGTTSSWQASTSYSDSGLDANKCYGYTVTARDSVGTPNTGTASSINSTYTSANTPGTPTLDGATATTLNLTNAENSNPASNPTTYFAVYVSSTSPTDSNWEGKWVNGSGEPSVSEVWLSDSALDSLVLGSGATPLVGGTTYGVKIKARNQDNDETALSSEGQGTTSSAAVSISLNTDGSVDFLYLALEATQDNTVSGINDVEVLSIDSGPANLDIKSSNFTYDVNTWALGVTNGSNQVQWEFATTTSNWLTFATPDTNYTMDQNVPTSATRNIYLRITMPTFTDSYEQYSSTVTITASAP